MTATMIQVTSAYSVVKGEIEFVVKTVNDMIAEQWQPVGAAIPVLNSDGRTPDLYQTMVKQGFAMVNVGADAGRIAVPQVKVG